MQWRETGSIVLDAPRERVFEVLARWMETDPGLRAVSPERFESNDPRRGASTLVLRPEPSGTRVILARTGPMTLAPRGRDTLRHEVEAELQRVERLVRAYGREG